jgi:hypothetical protein
MTREQKFMLAIGLGLFAAIVVLALSGYVHPAMLIDFANIRICS